MERLETLIQNLPVVASDPKLRARILAAIEAAYEQQLSFRRALFGVLAAFSGLSLVPATLYAVQSFSNSAFASYLSLFFTDSGTALSQWQTLALSLVESIPLLGVTLVVAAVFALLASLKAVAPYTGAHRTLSYHAS
jgi:hypothetical protein